MKSRLEQIAAIAARRKAARDHAIWADPEEALPVTIAPTDEESRTDDFSDLGERDLVRAFQDLTTKGRIK